MWQCPACGGENSRETHQVHVNDAAMYFVRPWIDRSRYDQLVQCITDLWGTETARLVRCADCALRSADPFVAGDQEFYALAYGQESFHPYPGQRWEYQLTQALIKETEGPVLEIGAGNGAFQRSIVAAGVDPSRLHATEYNQRAREALLELGVTVTATDFREMDSANYAVVCGHQVFEHLSNLDETFQAFDRLAAQDGFVALSVPDGTTVLKTESAGGEFDMPPNHVSTWCFTALDAAARRRGWRVAAYHEERIPRLTSARNLAVGRTVQARTRHSSFSALIERQSSSPRSRYLFSAIPAIAQLPAIWRRTNEAHGASIWVALKRER
jgi:SAM-dependent methyltransferase